MWLASSEMLRVSLLLLMRKKFLMRCETWLLEPLSGLLVDSEAPEKVRFSVMLVCVDAEELKSCVMVVTQGGCNRCRRGSSAGSRRYVRPQMSWRGWPSSWSWSWSVSWLMWSMWSVS